GPVHFRHFLQQGSHPFPVGPEVGEKPPDPLTEIRPGAEAEGVLRSEGAGAMAANIPRSGRPVFRGGPRTAGLLVNCRGYLPDGRLPPGPEVDDLADQGVTLGDAAEPVGRVFDVDKISGLQPVPEDHRRTPVQRPGGEARDDLPGVPLVMAARAEIVE